MYRNDIEPKPGHCWDCQSDQIRTNRTRTPFADKRLKIYQLLSIQSHTYCLKLPPIVSMDSRPPLNDTALGIILIRAPFQTVSYPCQRIWKLLCLKQDNAIFINFSYDYITRFEARIPSKDIFVLITSWKWIFMRQIRSIGCRSPKNVYQTLDHQGYDGLVSGRHRSGGSILIIIGGLYARGVMPE